ncbi:Protein of unknown function [Gryllus bimaculatus]|nr:Protein of unknown function [Gryllus bimaculatus]
MKREEGEGHEGGEGLEVSGKAEMRAGKRLRDELSLMYLNKARRCISISGQRFDVAVQKIQLTDAGCCVRIVPFPPPPLPTLDLAAAADVPAASANIARQTAVTTRAVPIASAAAPTVFATITILTFSTVPSPNRPHSRALPNAITLNIPTGLTILTALTPLPSPPSLPTALTAPFPPPSPPSPSPASLEPPLPSLPTPSPSTPPTPLPTARRHRLPRPCLPSAVGIPSPPFVALHLSAPDRFICCSQRARPTSKRRQQTSRRARGLPEVCSSGQVHSRQAVLTGMNKQHVTSSLLIYLGCIQSALKKLHFFCFKYVLIFSNECKSMIGKHVSSYKGIEQKKSKYEQYELFLLNLSGMISNKIL